ncbi:MAG: aspartate 1-decarboxylase [Phycisphaerae bacterium]
MFVKVLKSKIHRAKVTDADVDYVGSITIDPDLIEASELFVGQCVLVADLQNGERFETYVMEGERGSGTICVNGAAAHKVNVGDLVIVMGFVYVSPDQARELKPTVVLVDENNKPTKKL